MAETPATRSSLQRTPPPSLPYKLEIDQLKRRLALVAGGTDAAELTALLANPSQHPPTRSAIFSVWPDLLEDSSFPSGPRTGVTPAQANQQTKG